MAGSIEVFFKAIANEWEVDKDVDRRVFGKTSRHVFRPLKARPYLKMVKIGVCFYYLIAFAGFLAIPFYLFFCFIQSVFFVFSTRPPKGCRLINKDLILDFNGRTVGLVKASDIEKFEYSLLLRERCSDKSSIYCHANVLHCFLALGFSIASYVISIFKTRSIGALLHVNFSFGWFFVFFVLKDVSKSNNIDNIYCSNHYDRWTLLIDYVFPDQRFNLLQHGVLPQGLVLPFPPRNINCLWCFDKASKVAFERIYSGLEGVDVRFFSPTICVTSIDTDFFSVLIVGQPQSCGKEIQLVESLGKLDDDYFILLKPHPVFGNKIYREIESVVVSNRSFYPEVDIVVCESSTLGMEYERYGIPVIWWKEKTVDDVLLAICQCKRIKMSD